MHKDIVRLWVDSVNYLASTFVDDAKFISAIFSKEYINDRTMSITISREEYLKHVKGKQVC